MLLNDSFFFFTKINLALNNINFFFIFLKTFYPIKTCLWQNFGC